MYSLTRTHLGYLPSMQKISFHDIERYIPVDERGEALISVSGETFWATGACS